MKLASIIILLFAIGVSYSVPTFYEAFIEHKLYRISNMIMRDMLDARKEAIKSKKQTEIVFNIEDNSYSVVYDGKEAKKVVLADVSSSVVFYKGLFVDGVSLNDNKISFDKDGFCNVHMDGKVPNADSVYLIHKRDEAKNILERIVRIYIHKEDCSIAMLKVKSVTGNGELIFTE